MNHVNVTLPVSVPVKLRDRRTLNHKQVMLGSVFVLGTLFGGAGNEYRHYQMLPKWEDQQLKLVATELASPVTNDQLNSSNSSAEGSGKAVESIVDGKASYYTTEGCIGCNEMRKMSNGEILNDNVKTIALPVEQYRKYRNQMVIVANMDTEQVTQCKVTDTGGFLKYNRVADLSKACAEAIGLKTDVSNISVFK